MTLDNANNDFGGLLKIQAKQASVRDANALQVDLTAQGDSRLEAEGALQAAGTLTGAGTDLSLVAAGLMTLDRLAVSGGLAVQGAAAVALGTFA